VHFIRCERLGNCADLLVDIVLTNVFGERRELPFDIIGLLAFKRRGADFETTWAVTCGTGCNGTLRVARKY